MDVYIKMLLNGDSSLQKIYLSNLNISKKVMQLTLSALTS